MYIVFIKGFTLVEVLIALALCALWGMLVVQIGGDGLLRIYTAIRRFDIYEQGQYALHRTRFVLESGRDGLSIDSRAVLAYEGELVRSITFTDDEVSISEDLYDWHNSFGASTCDISRGARFTKKSELTLPDADFITDIDVLNGVVYIATDSVTASKSDLYLISLVDTSQLHIISQINTGTGSAGLWAMPGYVFLAEYSARYPLRVIHVTHPQYPQIVYEYRATASSSVSGYGGGLTVYGKVNQHNKRLYLGTHKSIGPELLVFDITNPESPQLLTTYEMNTQINSIIEASSTVYLATPGTNQVSMLSLNNNGNQLQGISTLTMPGSSVQDGKSLSVVGNTLYVGRTVGGFDNVSNHELFAYSVDNPVSPQLIWSVNVGASVNTLIPHRDTVLTAVGNSKNIFTTFNTSSTTPFITDSFNHVGEIVAMDCEDSVVVIAERSPARITVYEEL